MPKIRANLPWVNYLGVTLLPVLAGLGAFYFIRVARQKEMLDGYYLRVLAHASANLESTIETLNKNIKNLGEAHPKALEQVRGLELVKGKSKTNPSHTFHISDGFPGSDHSKPPGLWAELRSDNGGRSIYFSMANGSRYKAKLREILESTVPEVGFEAVLLADQKQEVLAHGGSSLLRLTRLPREAAPVQKGKAQSERSVEAEVTRSTQVLDVAVAGVSYKLYLQPVNIVMPVGPIACEDESPPSLTLNLLLAGLMKKSNFNQRAKAISPALVSILLVILVLTLFSVPFLSIRFMGSRDCLGAHRVMILTLATILGCAILIGGILYLFSRESLYKRQDEQLRQVAGEIQEGARQELSAMKAQLHELDRLKKGMALWSMIFPTGQTNPNKLAVLGLFTQSLSHYPFFARVFWMNENGMQTEKWSPENWSTPLINLNSRVYFQRAIRDALWYTSHHPGIFLESIISRTTGNVYGILSIKVEDLSGEHAVAAMSSEMLSLIRPVLPPGMGFCLLDREGLVLFHSDPDRNRRENFFDEIHPNAALRAAVATGAKQSLEGQYHTRSLRYRVEPLEVSPIHGDGWMLLVFAEKEPLWRVLTEVMQIAFIMLGMYFAILFLFCIGLYLAKPNPAQPGKPFFKWYWPNPDLCAAYLRIALVLLAFLLWGFLFLLFAEGEIAALVAATLGLIAVLYSRQQLDGWQGRLASFMEAGAPRMRRIVPLVWLGIYAMIMIAPLLFLKSDPLLVFQVTILALFAAFLFRRLSILFWMGPTLMIWVALLLFSQNSGEIWLFCLIGTLVPLLFLGWWPWKAEDRLFRGLRKWAAHGRNWLHLYRLSALLLLAITAMLPTISFFRLAYNEGAELWLKGQQVEYMWALRDRAQNFSRKYEDVHLSQFLIPILNQQLFPADFIDSGPGSQSREPPNAHGNMRWGVYGGKRQFKMEEFTDHCLFDSKPTEPVKNSIRRLLVQLQEVFPGFFLNVLDFQGLLSDREGIHWDRTADNLRLWVNGYRPLGVLGIDNLAMDRKKETINLKIESPLSFFSPTWGLAALLIGIIFFGPVVTLFLAQCFLTQFEPPRVMDGQGLHSLDPHLPRHRLVLRPGPGKAGIDPWQDDFQINGDLIRRSSSISQLLARAAEDAGDKVVLPRFHEWLNDPDFALKKLDLLEGLLQLERKTIILQADIDPLYYFTAAAYDQIREQGLEKKKGLDLLMSRWSTALEKFVKQREPLGMGTGADRGGSAFASDAVGEDAYLAELTEAASAPSKAESLSSRRRSAYLLMKLARECWMDSYLRALGMSLARHPDFNRLSPRQVVQQVGDLAEAHSRDLWIACSTEEKILLHSIARDGFVNGRAQETLRRLMRRGLVRATPSFHLTNNSFTHFVLHAELPEVLAQWVRQAGVGPWAKIRMPLALIVFGLLFFVLTTQPDTFFQIAGVSTALATGLPALMKLLTLVLKNPQAGDG